MIRKRSAIAQEIVQRVKFWDSWLFLPIKAMA